MTRKKPHVLANWVLTRDCLGFVGRQELGCDLVSTQPQPARHEDLNVLDANKTMGTTGGQGVLGVMSGTSRGGNNEMMRTSNLG